MLFLNTSVFEDLLGACFLTVFNWVIVIAMVGILSLDKGQKGERRGKLL